LPLSSSCAGLIFYLYSKIITDLVSPKYFGLCGSFPLGLLVYRSRFLPRFLGVWLAIGCFANLSLTGLLLPQYQDKVFTYSQPAFFGEVALMLWLIIRGARPPAVDATALSSAAG
jgi:hypothetical protein